jgi:glucose/arabinose dehydrogenase
MLSYSANSVLAEDELYVELENAFPELTFIEPTDFQHANDSSNRVFVVERRGIIKVLVNSNTTATATTFLDIRTQVTTNGGEEGLLGLAFHPDYVSTGYFYVYYSATSPRRSVISRFSVSEINPDQANASSELILLEINQPYSNHNGGQISFGPDGYLYIATGDGGGSGDPLDNSQNRANLLGNILRIDAINLVNDSYTIPEDNPFYNNTDNYSEEIFAYGLRNPWRFSFDPVTGWLWVADVGQNVLEEIDIVESGLNYGWNIKEGTECYNPPTDCNSTGLVDPIWEYDHTIGRSITGGYVYRGTNLTAQIGKYIYADFVDGQIWALEYDGVHQTNNSLLIDTSLMFSTFGLDQENNIYVAGYDTGLIYILRPSSTIVLRTLFPVSLWIIIGTSIFIIVLVKISKRAQRK